MICTQELSITGRLSDKTEKGMAESFNNKTLKLKWRDIQASVTGKLAEIILKEK